MNIKGTRFTIGADPEVFVRCKKTGAFVGAHGLLEGTKENPVDLPGCDCQGQVDGMALEYNTDVVGNAKYFSHHITQGKRGLQQMITQRWGWNDEGWDYQLKKVNPTLRLAVCTTAEFSQEEWNRAPDENKILGCEPDFNAWTEKVNNPPNAAATFRTGAGHVHIGWGRKFNITDDYFKVCAAFAREMDAVVGVASLLWDQDTKRRELYGKAGAFRPKSYGVEYRTLSNSWVRYGALAAYVGRRSFDAARNMMEKKTIQSPEARLIIDGNLLVEAKFWLADHHITLPPKQYRVD